MSISVHAISMIYELRALRARLVEMLERTDEFHNPQDVRTAEYMLSMIDLQISKVERTGEYIAALEREVSAAHAEEADLGEE